VADKYLVNGNENNGMIYDAGAPAGWYNDHELPLLQRYWDGTKWTESVRPRTPAGWYIDPEDRRFDRYWDGTDWLINRRLNYVGRMTWGGGWVQGAVAVFGFLFVMFFMAIPVYVGVVMIFTGEITFMVFGVALLLVVVTFTALFTWFNLKRLRYARRAIAARNATPEVQATVESDAVQMLPQDMRGTLRWAPPYLLGIIAVLLGILSFVAMSYGALISGFFLMMFTVVFAWIAWLSYRRNRKAGLSAEEARKTTSINASI
jgi:membrane protein YdbS with pleckstrin-like domain